ncbi:MAG: excinuclease ABC subunit UvrC [Patescibacteria group bacterium]
MSDHTTKQLKNLPQSPGCYLYKDVRGKILYVGKAKNLRNRVRSYFTKSADLSPAKQEMVAEIADIDYMTVRNETEALLLESTLIKQHQPKYNVVLKDDKFFNYIKIVNEPYSRVIPTRNIEKDGSAYFGPFSSGLAVRNTLKFLKRIAPFRTSKKNDFFFDVLNRNNHISENEYNETIETIKQILTGKTGDVEKYLQEKMKTASKHKEYERAALYRDRLRDLKKLTAKQHVILTDTKNIDVVAYTHFQKKLYVTILKVRGGKLLDKLNAKLADPLNEGSHVVSLFISDVYADVADTPSLILIPEELSLSEKSLSTIIGNNVKLHIPMRGKMKSILDLAQLNADEYTRKNQPTFAAAMDTVGALEQIKKALKLKKLPKRIECYDISNFQGDHAVGSMVVFTNGEPDKSQYRRFSIKYVPTDKPNDFAMMSEVLARRLKHDEWPLPDLLIVDGGKGQLTQAVKALENANVSLPTAGLAKKKEELFVPNKSKSIRLPKNTAGYFLLQRIRDEAHRFAITYYRKKHKKALGLAKKRRKN